MTDKKYTDDEIEKTLSLCGRTTTTVYCDQCPLCGEYECNREIKVLALDLINRQKTEIEKLKSNYSKLCEYAEKKEFELAEINADISWFREAKISRLAPAIKEIKAEACKEFAEKLKEIVRQNDYLLANKLNSIDRGMFTIGFEQAIDEILKEMVGEKDD